jgi:hypothetical protein
MSPIVELLLAAIATDTSARAIATRFGISIPDVDDLRAWPQGEREIVARWLLRP